MGLECQTETAMLCGFHCLSPTALISSELGRQGVEEQVTEKAMLHLDQVVTFSSWTFLTIFRVSFPKLDTQERMFT